MADIYSSTFQKRTASYHEADTGIHWIIIQEEKASEIALFVSPTEPHMRFLCELIDSAEKALAALVNKRMEANNE